MKHGKICKGRCSSCSLSIPDLTRAKRRPALVITELEGDDMILCQITSQSIRDEYAVSINEADFETGTLKRKSNVRPTRIFTADRHIVLYKVGHLKPEKINQIINRIVNILR